MFAILANPRNKYIVHNVQVILYNLHGPMFSFQLIKVTAGIDIKKELPEAGTAGMKKILEFTYRTSYYPFCIFTKVVCEILDYKKYYKKNCHQSGKFLR